MKLLKKLILFAVIAALALSFTACEKAGSAKIESVDDLPGKRIGVQAGTTGDIFATDYEEQGSTVERYNKGAEAIIALNQGKIDCVIIDNEPAAIFVERNEGLKILEEPFAVEEYAMCVAKDNTELKDKINGALKELKESGVLKSIIDNYIGENAGKTPYQKDESVERVNGTLVMATNAAFPPYEYVDTATEQIVGIDADIAQAVADKLGMELKIEDMDFDSIIPSVQSGKASVGIAGMTITEDRLKNIDFTDSYTTATQVIIVKK